MQKIFEKRHLRIRIRTVVMEIEKIRANLYPVCKVNMYSCMAIIINLYMVFAFAFAARACVCAMM